MKPDLCLAFANTRYWRGQAEPTETLNAAEDLAAWLGGNVAKEARPLPRREFERAIEAREQAHAERHPAPALQAGVTPKKKGPVKGPSPRSGCFRYFLIGVDLPSFQI